MLSNFNPISLETLQTKTPLLERTDTKYIAQASHLGSIIGAFLPAYKILQIGNDNIFSYNTIYFDTQAMDFYMDHHQGKRQRKKIRTRYYKETNCSFFEIKFKDKGKTTKKRMEILNEEHGIHNEKTLQFIQKHNQILYNEPFLKTISPSVQIEYKRITLTDNTFTEKVTFDFDFIFTNCLDTQHTPITHNNLLIIESKGNKQNHTAMDILKSCGLKVQDKCSKYCIGANLTGLAPKNNTFKHVMKKIETL